MGTTASACDDGREWRQAGATASACEGGRMRRRAGAANKIDKPKKERGEALLLPAPFLSVYFMVFRTFRKNLFPKNTHYRTKYFAQTAQHPA
ncbi:MAG: hypothetical protein DBX39_06395 [Bacillota bacterium]|nr:MAG: hypothetical protein DBX39_06395 [Bacillota bacterium]